MKQINKTIIGSIAAIVLSSNAFANNIIIDKTLIEAEMAANLNTMTAEITLPEITETAKMQIENIILTAKSNAKNDKTASTPTVEATAE